MRVCDFSLISLQNSTVHSLLDSPLSLFILHSGETSRLCEHPLMPATMEGSHNEKLEPPAKAGWENWFCGPFRCLGLGKDPETVKQDHPADLAQVLDAPSL